MRGGPLLPRPLRCRAGRARGAALRPAPRRARGVIREAFVTHTDHRFLRLSEVLVRGLARFSSRPVVVFGVDVDVDYDSPNLIKRRIESGGEPIAYLHLQAIITSGVGHGACLDA